MRGVGGPLGGKWSGDFDSLSMPSLTSPLLHGSHHAIAKGALRGLKR
jgi:hypothetical protein